MAARLSSPAVLALSILFMAAPAGAQRPTPAPAPAVTPNSVAARGTPATAPAPAQTGNGMVDPLANASARRQAVSDQARFYQGDIDATAGQYDNATDIKEQSETELIDNSLGSGTGEAYTFPERQEAAPAAQPAVRTVRRDPH